MDKQKLQEVFSDKAYMESIVKMSAEDAAKSLCEKGVEVTADDLMKVHDFIMAHKEQLQNGELPEDVLAEISGGGSFWGTLAGLSGGSVVGGIVLLLLSSTGW